MHHHALNGHRYYYASILIMHMIIINMVHHPYHAPSCIIMNLMDPHHKSSCIIIIIMYSCKGIYIIMHH